MRYLILICTAVATLLLSPLHQAVASPLDAVADCQGENYAASPCALVAPDLRLVVDAQPYVIESVSLTANTTKTVVRALGVLLRDFDGVTSTDITLAKASTTRASIADKIDRCVAYGESSREAVPRRDG